MSRPVRVSEQRCSFCGRGEAEAARLIAGPGIFICDACVRLCNEVLAGPSGGRAAAIPEWAGMSEEELLAHLPRIAALADNIDAGLLDRVTDLRRRGVSWARIGTALTMSRQAAWERFAADVAHGDR